MSQRLTSKMDMKFKKIKDHANRQIDVVTMIDNLNGRGGQKEKGSCKRTSLCCHND